MSSDEEELGDFNEYDSASQYLGLNGRQTDSKNRSDEELDTSLTLELEIRKLAPVIKPYHGELVPEGFLHGALSFGAAFQKTFHGTDPVCQVMSFMAPKLNEMLQYRRFRHENFDGKASSIGRGSFSKVWRMNFMKEGKPVAVKQFKDMSNPAVIYKEVHTLIALQHKRVVKLFGAFHDSGTYMVMELCIGSLRNQLGCLTRLQTVRFFIQLLEGIKHIHSLDIIHCDIKPDNCLITRKNNVVLADFGSAQHLPMKSEFIRLPEHKHPLGSRGYSDAAANSGIYSKSTDMFGLGCTIFEMETGCCLMEYKDWPDAPLIEYIKVVKEGRLLEYPPEFFPNAPNVETKWNLDGKRQLLVKRCTQKSTLFGCILKDMVQHSYGRKGAGELQEKYKPLFTRLLQNDGMTFEDLDSDVDLKDIRLLVDNLRPMKTIRCSNEINLALDLIYYDSELTGLQSSEKPKEEPVDFQAIQVDDIKAAIYKLIATSSVRVQVSGDGLPAVRSLSKSQTVLDLLSSVVRSTQNESSVTHFSGKGKASRSKAQALKCLAIKGTENISVEVLQKVSQTKTSQLNPTFDDCGSSFKLPNIRVSPGTIAPLQSPTARSRSVLKTPASCPTVFRRSPTPPEARNAKAYNETARRNQCTSKSYSKSNALIPTFEKSTAANENKKQKIANSFKEVDYRSPLFSSDQGNTAIKASYDKHRDVAKVGANLLLQSKRPNLNDFDEQGPSCKQLKGSWDEEIKTEEQLHTRTGNLTQPEFGTSSQVKGEKTKEDYIRNGETVPLELRGIAPSPKNLPIGFEPVENWAGWFDCKHCKLYYSHDHDDIVKHTKKCMEESSI